MSSDKNNNVVVTPGFAPTVFTYDLNNRPTRISGPGVDVQMKYFGDGKLAEIGGVPYCRYPASAGNRVVAELDGSGAIQREYVYGLGMISTISRTSDCSQFRWPSECVF